jgi:hypothetical protein
MTIDLNWDVMVMWVDARLHIDGLTKPRGVSIETSKHIAESLEKVLREESLLDGAQDRLAYFKKEIVRVSGLSLIDKIKHYHKNYDQEQHPSSYVNDVRAGMNGWLWGYKRRFNRTYPVCFGPWDLAYVAISALNKGFSFSVSHNRIKLVVYRLSLMIRIGFWNI